LSRLPGEEDSDYINASYVDVSELCIKLMPNYLREKNSLLSKI
jgi:protein tyrosine phosphatase